MIRILLADDHEMIRRGLRDLVESTRPEWEICGETDNGHKAVELAVSLKPHVAVVDLLMPELGGLETTRQIRRWAPQVEVLIFSMYESEQVIHDALAAGANGYVPKSETGQHLVAAIEALARHQPYFSGEDSEAVLAARRAQQQLTQPGWSPETVLTTRQREVAQLLAEGMSNKEIASVLTITVKTAKTHRAAIMRRLGAKTLVDVVHYATRTGLVAP